MTSDDELRAFLRARIPIGTQAAVARAAGLSPGRLSRYLAGFGSMRLAKLIPLLAHVGGTLTLTDVHLQ